MAVISLRPDLDQNVDALPLYISGSLPNGKPGLAYEGRLQIHNAVGACTVEQIGGDPLPPGGVLSVDHGTMEVVVAWPEYSEYVTPLQNPSFESGDLSGWTLTPKGGTATATADTSQKFDGAYSLRWPGGKGLGSEGGIEVEAWNNAIGPCLPGQRVTSHARCMYNPGGHNFGSRYQGLLRFVDGAGMPIGPAVRGRQFKGRGENGRWNDASATGVGPVGTKGVQMGAWLTGSNAPVWLDAASWDVPSSVGINIETTLNITLRVRDSAGRTALWSGQIKIITPTSSDFVVASSGAISVYSGMSSDYSLKYIVNYQTIGQIYQLCVSRGGGVIVCGAQHPFVRLFSISDETHAEIPSPFDIMPTGAVYAAAISPDSEYAFFANGGTYRFFRNTGGVYTQIATRTYGNRPSQNCAKWSPDSKKLLVSESNGDFGCRVFEVNGNDVTGPIASGALGGTGGPVTALCWGIDNASIAYHQFGGAVGVMQYTGSAIELVAKSAETMPIAPNADICFSPSGDRMYLAINSPSNSMRMFSFNGAKVVALGNPFEASSISDISLSESGAVLSAGSKLFTTSGGVYSELETDVTPKSFGAFAAFVENSEN